jgi:transcriptional regulator with XRE-family HTH domain
MAGVKLTIAEKIALTRKRLRETQDKFGDRFKVKKLTVHQWEGGAYEPAPEHLPLMHKLFLEVLKDDESEFETSTQQLFLPFGAPVKIDFRISPHSADRVRFDVEVRRKIS